MKCNLASIEKATTSFLLLAMKLAGYLCFSGTDCGTTWRGIDSQRMICDKPIRKFTYEVHQRHYKVLRDIRVVCFKLAISHPKP